MFRTPFRPGALLLAASFSAWLPRPTAHAAPSPADEFRKEVQPMLTEYCYDCHGDGAKKGGVTLDGFANDEELLGKRDLWLRVLQNLRAGLMPPQKKPHPELQDKQLLEKWIKLGPFQEDPLNADPGRVTIRRLNRTEYRNTIRDLMGTEFNSEVEFPPDDTGNGFDNMGDVLSISPLLLEKYLQAAEKIAVAAVPTISKVVATEKATGRDFRGGRSDGGQMSFYREATVARAFARKPAGTYRVMIQAEVRGAFDFDPGHCEIEVKVDNQSRFKEEFRWHETRKVTWQCDVEWATAGDHEVSLHLQPFTPEEQKKNNLDWSIASVEISGPLEESGWIQPENYERFFPKGPPPEAAKDRRAYAEEILRDFATRAYRRPVDERTLGQLLALAQSVYAEPGKRFEEGITRAMMAVLASPRFMFMVERPAERQAGEKYAQIDEYALASRLSYFFWSTMPDAELFQLASQGQLRKNLAAQVQRLLTDDRSDSLVRNFTGQWLQARDVEFVPIDARVVIGPEAAREIKAKNPKTRIEFDADLRRSMRSETGRFFSYILHEDRSLLDLLDSDYTFLNERLAKHYGIPGVSGNELRRVTLPEGSPRGGLLTQGTILAVTSNPTRTSPVKRGLFLLDNILGAPAPPPPPNVPNLEDAAKTVAGHQPTVRELLEIHRADPLCSSCHTRMDPLGLALENFNAMGAWRDNEGGQPLDTSGQLTTGEKFNDIRDLKRILKEEHRADFYRCVTEKLLMYALGRGLEYYDVQTVDEIVGQLEAQGGRSSVLLQGIINSAAFQRQRDFSTAPAKNITQQAVNPPATHTP